MMVCHFCSRQDMNGIRNKGITKGGICGHARVKQGEGKRPKYVPFMRPGWQWVTTDGDHERQSWATQHTIRTNRTECRWTVEIPEKEEGQLYNRDRLEELYPGSAALFDGWDGSENWFVFRGTIPKYWLRALDIWDEDTGEWARVWERDHREEAN